MQENEYNTALWLDKNLKELGLEITFVPRDYNMYFGLISPPKWILKREGEEVLKTTNFESVLSFIEGVKL